LSEVIKLRGGSRLKVVRSVVFSSPAPRVQGDAVSSAQAGTTDSGSDIPEFTDAAASVQDPDRILKDEFEKGVQEGKRQEHEILKQEFDARVAAVEEQIGKLLEAVNEQFANLYHHSEQAIIKFAFGVAERITRRETSVDGETILTSIKEGVTRILGVEEVKIRVHPDDVSVVRGHRDRIQANGEALREIVVEADDHLERGDCILESDLGNIDARISTQLKQIENVLFESEVVG